MKYKIYDETRDRHAVNESEAYGETEDYGNIDDPCYYLGDLNEAAKIAERLAKGTGHRFSLKAMYYIRAWCGCRQDLEVNE